MGLGLKYKLIQKLMPFPVQARHSLYSALFSADDDKSSSSKFLIDTALAAIKHAQEVSLRDVNQRLKSVPFYPDIWPGEHYKILAGLVLAIKPRLVIEVGTAEGLSALSMKKYLPPEGKVVTFDIIDWRSYPGAVLKEGDFADGRLVQYIDDLQEPLVVDKHRRLLERAEMIFFDAGKDGVMEQMFIDNFKGISFHQKPLAVFDDIRVWPMLKIWREITFPKLDLTSFGHWSGTGLVEWRLSD